MVDVPLPLLTSPGRLPGRRRSHHQRLSGATAEGRGKPYAYLRTPGLRAWGTTAGPTSAVRYWSAGCSTS